jgi:hypothetical protein
MSEQVVAFYQKNPLLIDKVGSFVNILRKDEEDISDYRERVIKAYRELYELDNESFWRSLSYITTSKEKNIGYLSVEDNFIETTKIVVSNEKINIVINGNETIIDFKGTKFLIDVIENFSQIPGLIFNAINDDDKSWHYCYSRNLIPKSSEKIYLRKTTSSLVEESPVDYPIEFYNWLERDTDTTVNDRVIFPGGDDIREGFIEYKGFPLLLTWNPFLALSCNKEEFKNILKDEDGLITQKGAKLINKILEKQNTYWGE